MIRYFFLICAWILYQSPISMAADYLPGPVQARVLRIIEGDTVKVQAHIWLSQSVNISVRLRGVDSPELNGACERERSLAKAAKGRLQNLLKGHEEIRVRTY